MSKVSTSTESNLKTARYKTSGSLVKNNQFSSRDKVMEVRTHAAHIKVKSYNSLIKNNSLSQSWYNNNTSSKSIQSEFKLNKRKWQPRNEAKLYDENTPDQNKSRYLTKKEEQQKLKRTPAYKRAREEQVNVEPSLNDTHSKIGQQSSKRRKTPAYKQQRTDEMPENFNNGIIRVTIPHQSIVNPLANVAQVIRLSEERELNHLTKVRSFKVVREESLIKNSNQLQNSPRYNNSRSNISKNNRMKLIRSNAHEITNTTLDTTVISRTRYSAVKNGATNNANGTFSKKKLRLIRLNQHQTKENQIINPSTRYNSNYHTVNNFNGPSKLKSLSRRAQLQQMSAFASRSMQNISKNEENDNLGNKAYQNVLTHTARLPAYKNTGKQIVNVLGESRKNIEGVFSQKTSITQMINNTNESRKHLNISSSVRKSIKNIDGNGDLGVDTVVQTKNALLKTDKTLRVTSRAIKNIPRYTKKTVSGLKKSVQAVKWTAKAIKQPIKTAKHLIMATKMALKSLLNPIVLKGVLIFGLVAMVLFSCIAIFSGVTSVYAALTYSSDRTDLDLTWRYVTEMDAKTVQDFEDLDFESEAKYAHINYFNYAIMYYPDTDVNRMLAYFTAKYDDFTFDEIKKEIEEIHSELYHISLKERTEEVEYCEETEEGIKECEMLTMYHLDIFLEGKDFEEWLYESKPLDDDELERYETMLELDGTTMLKELGNPLGNMDWGHLIVRRYGYYYKANKEDKKEEEIKFYPSIDVMPDEKMNLYSAISGVVRVSEKGEPFISITNEGKKTKTVVYSQVGTVSVTDGQEVKKGEVIGTVDSTKHLILSYVYDGETYNPFLYMEGTYVEPSKLNYFPSNTGPSFEPTIVTSQGWTWPTQGTNVSSYFGYRTHPITGEYKLHAGIDITPVSSSDPIQAMTGGTVTFAGYHVTGGNMVIINHGNGVQSYYMHLDSMSVKAGDEIDVAETLGIMGNTGGSTGTHLHFEIRINGKPVDPFSVFK